MPSRNIIKTYVADGYYHIYNRGVEKRDIFIDEQDCKLFLFYLKIYLSPKADILQVKTSGLRINRYLLHNLSQELSLLSFSLMPNHIHLLVKQYTRDGIIKLMRRLSTSYVMYFNKKYQRVGALFQNRYKATLVRTDHYLLHLSRYIHLNPMHVVKSPINFLNFSSYPYYLREKKSSWIKPDEILSYFKTTQAKDLGNLISYENFIKEYQHDSCRILGDLQLEDEF